MLAAHRALLRDALQLHSQRPLVWLPDERNIAEDGSWRATADTVLTGRRLLEESDEVLHGLRVSMDSHSDDTLLVVYGTQHGRMYRCMLVAAALGNLHVLFLPLYHHLAAALSRLRRQWHAKRQPRLAVFAPALYARQACELGASLIVATSGEAPPCAAAASEAFNSATDAFTGADRPRGMGGGSSSISYAALLAAGRDVPAVTAPAGHPRGAELLNATC